MAEGLEAGLLGGLSDPRIGPVLNAIHASPAADWSVERLAGEALMSRSAFAGRFKQFLGMSPMRYVTECRMQEAVQLLEGTELSVAEIAERSGYESEVAFRKAFRAVIGRPPGQLRRAGGGRARFSIG